MSRLALGAAQFGMRYGVANTAGQVQLPHIAAILARAAECGIDTVDTAIAYGDSESRLGSCGVGNWRIVSKLPPLPADVENVQTWAEAHVRGSLERLRIARLDALLLHRSQDMIGPRAGEYRTALDRMRALGWLRTIGVSIYEPSELDAFWGEWQPEIVQAPYNVLDRRLGKTGWLDRLHEHGIRVHVRSAFLQGLLLMGSGRLPPYFSRWAPLLREWEEWCERSGQTPLRAALQFVLADRRVESVVVGVESVEQLNEIVEAAKPPVCDVPVDIGSDDLSLIDPRQWKPR